MLPGYDPWADPAGAWFDPAAAGKALDFFPSFLRHVEGSVAGQPFRLEDWQRAVITNLFGWKQKDSLDRTVRRYREALIYVPRKNGKSPLAAGIGLCVFFRDPEKGQQDFVAAADREQAGMLFRHCKGMVEGEPLLASRCRVYGGTAAAGQSRSIVRPSDGSFLRVISADADTKHGGNSHLILVDELHAQPGRELIDVLTTSTASLNRPQPLTVFVTTADFNRPSVCNEKYDYAKKVMADPSIDPRFLPVVYEADAADDWTSPVTWAKANPNLGVSVSREYLERECKKAKEIPEYENTFKRLHLNLRTDADVRWLSSVLWDANATPFDPAILDGRDCYAGLDLANTLDVAALALVFPPIVGGPRHFSEDGQDWYVLWKFWVPADVAKERERTNRARYDAWIAKGWITRTEGDVIDYSVIRADLRQAAERHRLIKLGFDPFNATQLANELVDDGIECAKFVQSIANFNEPCRKCEELLMAHRLRHGGNPVARWMAGNVSIHTDGRGYKMPNRKKSTDKIDGITALLEALGMAITQPDGEWYTAGCLTG